MDVMSSGLIMHAHFWNVADLLMHYILEGKVSLPFMVGVNHSTVHITLKMGQGP